MADLANIKPVPRVLEIMHPGTGMPLGVRVNLVSLDDERLTKIRRSITDKRLHLEQRGKNFKAPELEENRLAVLVAAITGWEWYNPTGEEGDKGYDPEAMPSFGDEEPDFKPVNVRAVLSTLTWFGDQVNQALGETESFFGS